MISDGLLQAAEELEKEGISVEVSLSSPSIIKHSFKLLVVSKIGITWSAFIVSSAQQQAWGFLDFPM